MLNWTQLLFYCSCFPNFAFRAASKQFAESFQLIAGICWVAFTEKRHLKHIRIETLFSDPQTFRLIKARNVQTSEISIDVMDEHGKNCWCLEGTFS